MKKCKKKKKHCGQRFRCGGIMIPQHHLDIVNDFFICNLGFFSFFFFDFFNSIFNFELIFIFFYYIIKTIWLFFLGLMFFF
jgi:hypothetical protein